MYRQSATAAPGEQGTRRDRWLRRLGLGAAVLIFFIRAPGDGNFDRFSGRFAFTLDEVTYLRTMHSLATDGDWSLDEFAVDDVKNLGGKGRGEGVSERARRLDSGHVLGRDGSVVSVHLPGLPFLLAPAYALDGWLHPASTGAREILPFLPARLDVTRALMAAFALAALLLLARILSRFFDRVWLEILLLLLFVTASPFPGYVFQIYPEVAAAFFALLAMNAVFSPFRGPWLNAAAFVLGVSYLPWLHQRFALVSVGLVLALLLCRDESFRQKRTLRLVFAILFVSALMYFHHFYSLTGDPSPLSVSQIHGKVHARAGVLRRGLFGHLLHHGNGMLWVYPWTIFSLIGVYWAMKDDRRRGVALLGIFVPYYVLVSMAVPYSGITAPMGRFLVVLFPIFSIFAAYTVQDLVRSRSAKKLVLYGLIAGFVFLNRRFWFVPFNYAPNLVVYNLKCAAVLLILYAVVYMGDREPSAPGP